MIDAACFSYNIPKEYARKIVGKIYKQLDNDEKKKVNYTIYSDYVRRTINPNIDKLLITIDEAIRRKRKVKITFGRYNLKKEFVSGSSKQRNSVVIVSPYTVTVYQGKYFLLCHGKRLNIDAISSICLDEIYKLEIMRDRIDRYEDVIRGGKGLDYGDFIKHKVYMNAGHNKRIVFRTKEEYINTLIEYVGLDFDLVSENEDGTIDLSVVSNIESVLPFAMKCGDKIEIIYPDELRDQLKEYAINMMNKYCK